jgi:hypothetical protein
MKTKLKVTMGLPGSGKTHWADEESNKNTYHSKTYRIDFDDFTTGRIDEKRIKNMINDYVSYSGVETIIVDGMFLTYDDVSRLISIIDPKTLVHISELSIEYWSPIIETCLHNDKGRRNKNSTTTIKNAKMDDVDVNFISRLETDFPKLKGKVKRVDHLIIPKPDWKRFAEEYGLYMDKDGTVKGESWCLGGTWGNCWGDEGTVPAEAEPANFEIFDSLLEKICPNITFLQYKSIYSEVVRDDTSYDSDYYGGSTTYAYRYFKVSDLYEALKSRKLIK